MPRPGATSAPLANGDVLVVREAFFNPGTGAWPATVSFPERNHRPHDSATAEH
jgi:hypothetical protein